MAVLAIFAHFFVGKVAKTCSAECLSPPKVIPHAETPLGPHFPGHLASLAGNVNYKGGPSTIRGSVNYKENGVNYKENIIFRIKCKSKSQNNVRDLHYTHF